ncbi:uncharacterized protein I303_100839 [Kwoniella dejecticola CBS 10117]|uniref:Major facilitator superfamily (MFS) profile domain-containing protein n=1 Tax=Kwoniella dejecticola CBS 10117 TaxID=1296121 RepID=A0A1A6AG34_9TREE|nr:uncharacterized protein I303_00841 [Kwoniella dejecticola CBS 10117]OBR89019.1 hypothetical protein I303_00841 [Kwoniella dejecticola CBS 10117]
MTNLYNQIVLLAVSVGSFNYGFSFGVASVVLGLGGFLEYFDVSLAGDNPSYASSMQGAIVGIFFAGGFFGSFLFAWLADRVGRRRALDVVGLFALIGCVLSAASVHIGMLLIGRILSGIAGGGLNVIPPMFQSEISVAEHRGRNVGLHGFMFVFGLAAANWGGLGAYFAVNTTFQWRLLLALQAVPTIILLALRFWLPETPRWLIMNGRSDQALDTLRKLHDDGSEIGHRTAEYEQNSIIAQVELDSRQNTSWKSLLIRPSTRRRLLLGIFLMFLQQSTGQNVLYGFQINTLSTLGLTEWQPLLVVAFYVSWAATLNLVGGFMLDRFGRRTMLLVGLAGSTLATSIHTPLAIIYGGTSNKAGAGAAVAFLFLFITFFAPGIDVTSYVYGAEIFPTYMRARGLSVTIATYFAFAALYISVSSKASARIGAKFNIVFIGLSTINLIVGYFVLPETKGLSLEEMGVLFGEDGEVAHVETGSSPTGPMTPSKLEDVNVQVQPTGEEK